MNSATKQIRLGDATYHEDEQRIVTAFGEEILLRSQTARVLQFLVSRLGKLAAREDIISDVWPDVSVTDDSLTQCILEIRRAIGDADRAILKTVPKRGFVLNGTVVHVPASGTSVSDAQRGAYASPSHGQGDQTLAQRIVPQLDARDVLPTLAVLPFRTQPSGGQAAIISAFLGDEITTAISRSEDMNVISRLSTVGLSGQNEGLEGIGRMLNSDFLVSGSVFESGKDIVLHLEFAETESQVVLFSDRIGLDYDNWIHDADIIDRVVTKVRQTIMINEVRRIRSLPLTDLKLFSALHGAVGLMHRFSRRDFNLARNYLEFVISEAPEHPTPLAWYARWHVLRAVQGWAEDPKAEAKAALDLTARALDIDPDHSLALVCEGQVLAHLLHRLDDAQMSYDAALQVNPNDAEGLALRGMFAAIRDRGGEGKRDAERALHLSPLHPHRFFFLAQAAVANIAVNDHARAVTLANESLRLNRTHVSTLRTLAIAQVGAGMLDDARKTGESLMRLQPNMSVSNWLRSSPSSDYELGRSAAEKLRRIGIPD